MSLDRWLYIVRLRIRSICRGADVERELDEELREHIARRTEEGMARGLSAEDARHAAMRAMGGLEQRKEECRDRRRVSLLQDLVRDLRYGVRMLRRAPGFTVVAVLSLTLGIGANTSIFQLLDALRLRPLPVTNPGELAVIQIPNRIGASGGFNGRYPHLTYAQWEWLRANQQAFSGVLAWGQASFDLATRGQSRFAENGLWVSGSFFNVLGIPPLLGRLFSDADDARECGAPGVVLSHTFWRRELAADPTVVGKTITLDGHPLDVIGVTPPGFYGVEVGRSFDLALPLCAEPLLNGGGSRLDQRWAWWLAAMGRLKPGWSLGQASAHLDSLSPTLFRDTLHPGYSAQTASSYLAFRLGALPGTSGFSRLRQQYAAPLWLLLALAGTVLLIACANLANLLLARMGARSREVAVRLALGASRGRLARQLFVESLLLATIGAACGAWLAPTLSRFVVAMMSSAVSPMFVDLNTDWRVLAFTAGLAVGTCVLFGMAPALRAVQVAPHDAMKSGGGTSTPGRPRLALRQALVVVQVALSLVLLFGGLLFTRTLINLLTVDSGFQQHGILEADVDLTRIRLAAENRGAFYRALMDQLRPVLGVDAVASAMTVPMVGNWSQMVHLDASARQRKGIVNFNGVSSGYFDTLRTPLLGGRDFDEPDTPESPRVAIVNEAFVQRFFGGVSPIGRTFQLDGQRDELGPPIQIVGLVRNTKYGSLREEFGPIVYLGASQHPTPGEYGQILIRTNTTLNSLMPSIKAAIERLNPDIAFHFHDFQEQIRYSLLQERLMATLCGFFALLAAVLATIGVYGVISYSASQRTNEIGIRLALGASRRGILALVLREAAALLGIGLAAGAAVALMSMKSVGALLYGLQPNDLETIAAAIVLLATVAAAASYLPARRATRVDPVVALRCQ